MGVDHEEASVDLAHKHISSICPVWYDKNNIKQLKLFYFWFKISMSCSYGDKDKPQLRYVIKHCCC